MKTIFNFLTSNKIPFPAERGGREADGVRGHCHAVSVFAILALFITMPAFATDPDPEAATTLAKKTVASKAYVDTKQDAIPTDMVDIEPIENWTLSLPAIATYDSTDGLVANKIGIWDSNRELGLWDMIGARDSLNGLDDVVPTVAAVVKALESIDSIYTWIPLLHGAASTAYSTSFSPNGTDSYWPSEDINKIVTMNFLVNALALKQNKLPTQTTTTNYVPKGAQTITLATTENGAPGTRYITAGGNVGLTTKSGAPALLGYVNGTAVTDSTAMGTFTTNTFGANNTTNQNNIKQALVTLELLKDVYGDLDAKITNNALPTGTTGTVVTYNGTNATTGVQEFSEKAVTGTVTYTNGTLDNANNIATINAVGTRQKKKECGGYEPAAAGQPAHDGTHPGDEDYCWLWIFPED